ncbi:MAG TPA: GNAT family N-acetyltransferase [Actinocatenispora sp.]
MAGDGTAVIRAATGDDLDAVAAIFGHYVTTSVATFEQVPPPVTHWQGMHAELSSRGLPFLVAAADGAVVGYAYATPWRTKPAYRGTVEDSVYVAPGQTGRGVGRRLLRALLDESQRAGVEQVIAVIADTGDPASVALHQSCGFVDAGRLRQVGRKQGRVLDTLLLQRRLRTDDAR